MDLDGQNQGEGFLQHHEEDSANNGPDNGAHPADIGHEQGIEGPKRTKRMAIIVAGMKEGEDTPGLVDVLDGNFVVRLYLGSHQAKHPMFFVVGFAVNWVGVRQTLRQLPELVVKRVVYAVLVLVIINFILGYFGLRLTQLVTGAAPST